MPKRLVFVGGGHAHLTALAGLRDTVRAGHRVTVIGPSPYHYYSGMGPGLLSGIYRPAEARFHVKKMAQDRGATFIEDRVVLVDPVRRTLLLGSGAEVRYDAVSFNTGSEVPLDLLHPSGDDVFPVKPIENLLAARRKIREADVGKRFRVVVVGGGSAAVEMAANLGHLGDGNGPDRRDHSRIPVDRARRFPREGARAGESGPRPVGRRNDRGGRRGIDRRSKGPVGKRRESRGRHGVRRDRDPSVPALSEIGPPHGRGRGVAGQRVPAVRRSTLNCSGAGIASPWRDLHWPGSASMPFVRTAPSTGTCRRFSRTSLFNDSIPGATIS